MVFTAQERRIPVTVAALYANDGQHVFARSEFVLSQQSLVHLPVVWYGAVHVDTAQIPQMQRALFAAYPTVTVINIADLLDTVAGVVHQVTLIVRFLAAFSILSGLVILASSVASTRFRRIREVVVLKTLGARRARVAAVFGVEFTVLGLLAGVRGRDLRQPSHLHPAAPARCGRTGSQWLAGIAAAAGTALLAVLHRVARQYPHPRAAAAGSVARGVACPSSSGAGWSTLRRIVAAVLVVAAAVRIAVHRRPFARHERYQKEDSKDRGDSAADHDTRQRLLRLRTDAGGDRRGQQSETGCHAGHDDRAHLVDRAQGRRRARGRDHVAGGAGRSGRPLCTAC